MEKLGFSLQSKYASPVPEVLKLLQAAGFAAVSPGWERGADLTATVSAAERCGLILQSLHGPVRGLAAMWSREEACFGPILQDLLRATDECAKYGIPILVVHSWNGKEYTFREEDLYFDNFDVLLERAAHKGVRVAFENLEGPEYLAALMTHYADSETVGLCWDSGHELCYNPGWDFLRDYGDRLLMTHLNDNFGRTSPDGKLLTTDDLHLLPGDGTADWAETVEKLKKSRKQEILNFELKIRPKGDRCIKDLYSKMPLEEFFVKAYETASRALAGYFE